jgi:hypothetical protein
MSHLSLETLPAGGGFVPIGLTRDGRVDAATPSGADGGRDT